MRALPSVDTFSAFPTTTIAHDGIIAKRVIVPECGMTTPPSATDGSQVHRERVTGAAQTRSWFGSAGHSYQCPVCRLHTRKGFLFPTSATRRSQTNAVQRTGQNLHTTCYNRPMRLHAWKMAAGTSKHPKAGALRSIPPSNKHNALTNVWFSLGQPTYIRNCLENLGSR